ncbi:hypothetical protein [Streptomyces sp. R35]|uniref:Uncharacterized protein n=1 Tax=Streptomyces sp. R35 TaxID=3238630 RepID=A0AB39S2G8_9ACTN
MPDEAGQLGRRRGAGPVSQWGGPGGGRGDQSLGDVRLVHAFEQRTEALGERPAQARRDISVHELRMGVPQPGRDRAATVGVKALGRVQRRPQRFGERVAHVVLGDAKQHHGDLVRSPAAHPRDQRPYLSAVLPEAGTVEARGQQEAQDRGPALLVRAGREPPVDLVLGRRARRLEPLVPALPHPRDGVPPKLRALAFQKVDEPADAAERGRPHLVERVVPTGFGHQGVVEHGRDHGRGD